jgi:hypothetical protein
MHLGTDNVYCRVELQLEELRRRKELEELTRFRSGPGESARRPAVIIPRLEAMALTDEEHQRV